MSKHYVVSESYPGYRYHIRTCSQDDKERKENHRPNTVFALCGGEVRWDTLCPLPTKPESWQNGNGGRYCQACYEAYRGTASAVTPSKTAEKAEGKKATKTIKTKDGSKHAVPKRTLEDARRNHDVIMSTKPTQEPFTATERSAKDLDTAKRIVRGLAEWDLRALVAYANARLSELVEDSSEDSSEDD